MKVLVVDTNCFIHNFSSLKNLVNEYAIVTSEDVYNEIRDPKTNENINLYLPNIKVLNPSANSLKIITNFSKRTGDYNALSR